ncbi:MAG TPA: hypothetical protein VG074_14375 [Acidimicrobiales bacterium]|jgi:hypothetical protein|nr:hypothetical protein [Acidimicrobiales bacterium]
MFNRRRKRQAKQAYTAEVCKLALYARGMCVDALWVASDSAVAYGLSTALDEYDKALRLIRCRLTQRPDLGRLIDQTIV